MWEPRAPSARHRTDAMPIALSADDRERAVHSLRRYADEELEAPLGDLAAGLLLDFVLDEIGPSVYNRALADLDVEIGLEEFPYWARRG